MIRNSPGGERVGGELRIFANPPAGRHDRVGGDERTCADLRVTGKTSARADLDVITKDRVMAERTIKHHEEMLEDLSGNDTRLPCYW